MSNTQNSSTRRRRRSGGFLWGLSAGLLAALALVAASDLRWGFLPSPGTAVAGGTAGDGQSTAAGMSHQLFLAGSIPTGVEITIDGGAVETRPAPGGTWIEIPDREARLELRGELGALWSTRLPASPAESDTLRPEIGGEIVVEVQRQGPVGALHLDGRPVGAAPGSLGEVPPGWHVISIHDGEEMLFQDACEVRPGEVTVVSVPPVPPRGKGRLLIRSRLLREGGYTHSFDDVVHLDGEPVGVTPLEVTVEAGFHSISVQRDGFGPMVEVLYLPAGQSRHVDADFGREDILQVSVTPPQAAVDGTPAAIPVRIEAMGETVRLEEGQLLVVRAGQSTPVAVPLVASRSDENLWVAVVPGELLSGSSTLSGYAECRDEQGRKGFSEIFTLPIR